MPIIFNKYYPVRTIVFFLGEGLLIFLSLLISDWFFTSSGLFYLDLGKILLQAFLVTMIFQLCLYFFDLYDLASDLTLTHTVTRMTQAFGVGCIILGTVYYTIPFMMISGRVFWAAYIVICLSVSLWRGAYYLILRKRLFVQCVIIVGTGDFASDIAREIEGVHDSIYKIISFIGESEP
ncbi:nucleoside-diphosphate sugar epimerase/dehydratase, partial [Desulfomarina sp.]